MQVPNNYETDLIFPIIKRAAELAGVNYASANESTKTSLKVPFILFLSLYFLWCAWHVQGSVKVLPYLVQLMFPWSRFHDINLWYILKDCKLH